ncbi:cardiolipin synthase [Porphyromonas sp. COT-239 OH1446]|uniref:cardiolipin synthase n=1 Tax=Porphyromonas sp. COT-239 OH1446 TaxID=1515613 RepID=UPI00052B8237|nr:cardiolipin synthase [Porphyromonas sp. COT-239 OH1446]KGN72001.1 cardiolipin synthetase [Porphyromonas sp. COT-239 OH1446]
MIQMYDYTLAYVLLGLYLITILGVVGTVISENRNPLKATAWVLIVVFIPFVGLLAYIIFGQDQRRLHRISRRFYNRLMRHPRQLSLPRRLIYHTSISHERYPLIHLLEESADSPLLQVDHCEIYAWGEEMYARLEQDIVEAQEHIHLQAYIFEEGELLNRLEPLLIERAQAGLSVRIIYDYLGSYSVPKRRWAALRKQGIEVYAFLPVAIPLLSSTVNYRNHRKVIVIDGVIGYMGGMNFADRYLHGDNLGPWRDTHFRLQGAVVAGLQTSFLVDWYSVSRRVVNMERYFQRYPAPMHPSGPYIQLVLGGPMNPWPTIELALLAMIAQARSHILIQTPYFLPTETINTALITAALSGLRVELMLPERTDSRLTSLAANSYLDSLLSCGVHIYRYREGFLHSKLILVDSELSMIGSTNMDFRSLEHNFEIGGVVYDARLTQALEQLFEQDKARCNKLSREAWLQRGRAERWGESIMRLFSPLL